jgi:hypothetical protein
MGHSPKRAGLKVQQVFWEIEDDLIQRTLFMTILAWMGTMTEYGSFFNDLLRVKMYQCIFPSVQKSKSRVINGISCPI